MQTEEVLQNLGLTEAEAGLYITLLKTGECGANRLSKITNTNRTFTYDRLRKLTDKGLVSYVIKDNKKYFRASNPNQLLEILKERKTEIESVIPKLNNLVIEDKEAPKVEVYTSKKGVRTALNLALKENDEIIIEGSLAYFRDSMSSFYEIWNKRREKESVFAKILTDKCIDVPYSKVELLSEDKSSAVTTFTFNDYVVLVLWSEVPVAILTKNKDLADNHRRVFNNILDREIKIYTGVEGIRKSWMELVENESSELVGFGFSWSLAQIYGRDFSEKWHKQREKRRIPTRLISYNDEESLKYFNVRSIEHKDFNILFLEKDLSGPACVTISDSLMVTFLYTEKKFKVIVNKNKETISIYKKHFETLWKKSKSKK